VHNTARHPKITVSADGKGIVSQAGVLLLAETLRVTGLGEGLADGLAQWRAPRAVHDPGKIITDLAMTLALGGDCLADIAVLRSQPGLCGQVASDPVCPGWSARWPPTRPGRCGRSAEHGPRPASGPGPWLATGARCGRVADPGRH
jgi:Transposase DDE domain group 1